MMHRVFGFLTIAALSVAAPLAHAQQATPAVPTAPRSSAPAPRLPVIGMWGYQLQNVDVETIARSALDLVVIDYSPSPEEQFRVKPADVRRMQRKPDGSRRVVLAYMSIGEAETYRFYWDKDWVEPVKVVIEKSKEQFDEGPADPLARTPGAPTPEEPRVVKPPPVPEVKLVHYPKLTAPVWLGHENESWPSNYQVRYWEKGWQDIIFGARGAYLERVLASGFDGVYLDRVDAFYGAAEQRPTAKSDMARFVVDLARHARTINPNAIVVPQNAEELLLVPEYLGAIDGIAKEDLLYGYNEGQPNPTMFVRNSFEHLGRARDKGLPVMVVEYLEAPEAIRDAHARITERGFLPFFSERGLGTLQTVEQALARGATRPVGLPRPGPIPGPPAASAPPTLGRGKSTPVAPQRPQGN